MWTEGRFASLWRRFNGEDFGGVASQCEELALSKGCDISSSSYFKRAVDKGDVQ